VPPTGASAAVRSKKRDEIWAVKDVSFEMPAGEVLGVIGRNGAGKSTLLKILSRITEPTEGIAIIRGRVGSLLEVGTGFHPELTGRENVYLNGAILGMRKREIERKFDEIVAFAEVERFIDTPVKRYSSGMYVRLAFAVAAHLEPEVLLVDEVLAVGDTAFQKRCLGRMGEVAREGRTVLFVSHNLIAVRTLCERAILLRDGRLAADGTPAEAIDAYLGAARVSKAETVWGDAAGAPGNELFRLSAVRIRNTEGLPAARLWSNQPFDIEVEYRNLVEGARLGATVVLFNEENVLVFGSLSNTEPRWHGRPLHVGIFRSTCRIPGDLLAEGGYTVSVIVWTNNYASSHREDEVVEFEIELDPAFRDDYLGSWPGILQPRLEWTTDYLGDEAASPTVLPEAVEPSPVRASRQ